MTLAHLNWKRIFGKPIINYFLIMYGFGKAQTLTSQRMQQSPRLAGLIYKIFGYTSLGNYARAQIFIKLLKELPLERFRHILDLGCGMGEYSLMMAENLPQAQVTAIDILPDRVAAVKKAKTKLRLANLEVKQRKIEDLEDQKFDFIFSVDVFEHIPEKEMPFRSAFERLNKGGYLLVKMPDIYQFTIMPENWFEEHNEWLGHEHVGQVYNLEDLSRRFGQEGFEVIHAAYADGPVSRLAWEINYLAKKGGAALHLLLLPLCKGLVKLDVLLGFRNKGNTIQVIGRKK
jgi:SAM-dependent methyltransferase